MHITDGILTETITGQVVLAATTGAALAGIAYGLRKLDYERVPRAAVLSSVFFIASLIHFKVGPTSVHLSMNGLVGIILGWASLPAFVIALLLQAMFFGHGGLTTIGVNSFNFGLSAIICFLSFNRLIRKGRSEKLTFLWGFAAGFLANTLASALTMAELMLIGESFVDLSQIIFIAHLPIGVIEGFVTATAVTFLKKVRPELLQSPVR